MARRAAVAVGTVSVVLNDRAVVAVATRARVLAAIDELGYLRGAPAAMLAPHQRRNGFATWLFQPAATGRYPGKAPLPARPVPVLADPWPGVPVRGRNAAGRADACWLPVAPGHEDGSVQTRSSHTTSGMTQRLVDGLTGLWTAALKSRRAINPRSPVAVLDRLLAECGE